MVVPPFICATEQRPDVVIWSMRSRLVILLELTCGEQMRKEARYASLMKNIVHEKWTPTLLTLEIGARGLVGTRTFRSFVLWDFLLRLDCLFAQITQ